jgi:signal peptidase I
MKFSKSQWMRFGIAAAVYILFTVWTGNYWLLLGLSVIADIYLTKFIPWGAWKKVKNPALKKVMEWADAIIFALVAVYIINLFIFQNYEIPSSSLEKTLQVGDFLFVSKLSYGPRVPNTPLSFPLTQHTFPVLECKSYIDWPQWDYKRLKGTGQVIRNDIVVYNFPAGDTVALKVQNPDYYTLCRQYGRDSIHGKKDDFGEIVFRPVDRRENYVKRCVGMPGDTIEVRDNALFIDGKQQQDPKNMQLNYFVETEGVLITEAQFRILDVSKEDRIMAENSSGYFYRLGTMEIVSSSYAGFFRRLNILPATADGRYNPVYRLPLTKKALETLKRFPFVKSIHVEPDDIFSSFSYPVDYETGWTRDNYGPLWIPRKGETIVLNEKTLGLYAHCIVNYEGNTLRKDNGNVYLNGVPANSYTFKYDYYFMMGDNRHNSADSRSWGFVPEDHVVGKPILVWLSLDKDRSLFKGKIRWNRLFKIVHSE